MYRHLIDWQIPRGVDVPGQSFKTSELDFASGWTVVCFWSSELPANIAFCGMAVIGHFVIDVNLTLLRNGTPVLTKKFVQFMESESDFIMIKLDDAKLRSSRVSTEASFSLKGLVDISYIQEFVDRSAHQNSQYNASILMPSVRELSNDFAKLLDPKTAGVAADVTVTCGSAIFHVHKFVLSARSPVFAAMFVNPMSEGRDNEVVIADVDVSVLRVMLTFIYTGLPPQMTVSTACDVMIAADKYQVPSLITVCCEFLKQNVKRENVLLLLDLGDAIAEDLKSCAMDYINQCPAFPAIQNSEAWKSLEKKKPALAIEVLSTLMKSKDKKIHEFQQFKEILFCH